MYHIYQTDGWILGGVNVGEANRFLDLFTSELGLVRAMAQGVRKLNSKLRYGLQDYFFVRVSLVRGRDFWRIMNVERLNDFNWIYKDREIFRMICRIFSLLRRLVIGEGNDAVIFEDINLAIKLIDENDLSRDEKRAIEVILVFRILQRLGYVGRDSRLNYLADFSRWEVPLFKIDNLTRSLVLKQINSSLMHSHL